jgi:hypothetical protein
MEDWGGGGGRASTRGRAGLIRYGSPCPLNQTRLTSIRNPLQFLMKRVYIERRAMKTAATAWAHETARPVVVDT